MKFFIIFLSILSSLSLFADEFEDNSSYIKNDILVGEGNFKVGFNLSYEYSKHTYESDSESKSIYFSVGDTSNFIPYQPMSSGIFAIYGINDSLQLFASFKGYQYSKYESKSSFYNNENNTSVKGGSPFLGLTYGIYLEDILLSFSPYVSVPFYEKYKIEDEKEDDKSFEQYWGYGFLLNFNYVKDNYLINAFVNYRKYEYDIAVLKYITLGFDFGLILNSSNDKLKAGILKESIDNSIKANNPLELPTHLSNTENYYKITITYNFNINSNNAINIQGYYYLPTEDKEDVTNYGIAFQFEFK